MPRLQVIIRRMVRFFIETGVRQAFLAAGLVIAAVGAAEAVTGGALIGLQKTVQMSRNSVEAWVIPAGVCADGSYNCPGYEPVPPTTRGSRSYEWRQPSPPYEYDKPAKPPRPAIEVETIVEEAPPCDEVEYAAHSQYGTTGSYGAQGYADSGYDDSCGVRCWYRRLRAGYCGRGCDYYRYRLNEYPRGNLAQYRRKKLACRSY